MASLEEAAHWLAALEVDAATRRWVKPALYAWCVEEQRPLSALLEAPTAEVAVVCALTEEQTRALTGLRVRLEAARAALRPLAALGVEVATRADVAYPEELAARLPEERLPYYLLYKGDLGILTEPGVMLAGATQPDAAAEAVTRALASGLAGRGRHLVGGYERGVDRLALESAARAGGTITLMAPLGLAHCQALLEHEPSALAEGRRLVVSPYAPDAPLSEPQARARRTLVAALCDQLCLLAPDEGPESWPLMAELLHQGTRAWVWRGSATEPMARWLALGAQLFDGRADEVAGEVAAPETGTPEARDGLAYDLDEAPESAFADADEAIATLGRLGRVPEKLARRLRESSAWARSDAPGSEGREG